MTMGFEVVPERHQAGVRFVSEFSNVLTKAGTTNSDNVELVHFEPLVQLYEHSFVDKVTELEQADCCIFNNFGPWMDSPHPGRFVFILSILLYSLHVKAPASKTMTKYQHSIKTTVTQY